MKKLRPENTEITIYSTVWCGPCKMAKNFLTEHGFSFKEIDIEKHNISRKEMAAMTKEPQSLKLLLIKFLLVVLQIYCSSLTTKIIKRLLDGLQLFSL